MAGGRTPCGMAIPQSDGTGPVKIPFLQQFLKRTEELGYDSIWTQEQILSDAPILEPVAVMNYAAALTSRVRIGSSVILMVLRNPIQLAKSIATLDHLSQGRVTLGVSIGGPHMQESVFGAYTGKRSRRFVEGLQVMKALWTEPLATFKGENWQFEKVAMEPKPIQKPHPPIWFGARTPIGLKRAVRHSNGWMGAGSSSSADFVQHVGLLRQYCDELKRDPATLPLSKRVYVAIDNDKARAERRLREWFAMRYKNAEMAVQVSLWGSRAEVTDKLGALVKAGAQHLMLNPVFDEIEHLEDLAQNVMPHL
ncbi:MAG: LLM class flavin-dependent oxidoreductase [Deltaproteobacteria bacterium]|nr:LLM class flavin-dependent oxidoreductase [Deltaproteobacteria bacterium]